MSSTSGSLHVACAISLISSSPWEKSTGDTSTVFQFLYLHDWKWPMFRTVEHNFESISPSYDIVFACIIICSSTYHNRVVINLLCPRPGGIKRWCCLTSVCLTSVWCLCVAFIGPKSRTERPRKTKIGTEVAHVTRDSNTTFKVKRSKVKVTRPLWLAVLAGQHGDRVSDRSICVYDVYRVTTCRPGRGHIVAAARLQLVIVITLNKHRGKDRLQSCDRSLDGTGAETHTCREKPEWSTLHVRKSSFEINWRQYSRAILHSATMLLHFRRWAGTAAAV